jgi:hypothetical protein
MKANEIDLDGLKSFLEGLAYENIETCNNRNGDLKLFEGYTIEAIEYFKKDKSKIPLSSVINIGDAFLVDALGNDLSVCIASEKMHRLPDGRKIKAKFVATIITDCRAVYGSPVNNCWIIPIQFVKVK